MFQFPVEPAVDRSGVLSNHESIETSPSSPNFDRSGWRPLRARSIRAILRQRAKRACFFESKLFSDPAWDMLLELYADHLDQRPVSIASLCRDAHVTGTTGLRWLSVLEQDGLITRRPDPLDARRVYIELSPEGASAMNAYFADVWLKTELL